MANYRDWDEDKRRSYFKGRWKKSLIKNVEKYSSDINIISIQDIFKTIHAETAEGKTFLDVGGGSTAPRRKLVGKSKHVIMDIEPVPFYGSIVGDICNCPEITSSSFDIVFSKNVLEHVEEPWSAALEMLRITKPGGLLAVFAPFSWRYHPCPKDHWRFSHSGLEKLFSSHGTATTILSGYDISLRRKNHVGRKTPGLETGIPPIDGLGGWREHWNACWLGRKK